MSAPLPPGWTALQTHDGRWYFHNASSNLTQWHPPHPQQPPQYSGYPQAPPSYPGMSHPGAPSGYPAGVPAGAPAGAPMAAQKAGHSGGSAGSHYTYGSATEYKLKEKAFSLSGDGFSVKNTTTGAKAFKVKGNAFSLKDSKKIVDGSTGQPIYSMVENILTLRGRMQIKDSSSKQPVATLRKKGFIKFFGTSTVQVWRGGTDEGQPWLQCKGDFLRKNFDFKEPGTGRVVASVRRKSFNLSNLLLEKDTYIIRIEPGTDCALLVFLVVALDEQYRDDGNRTGLESRLGFAF